MAESIDGKTCFLVKKRQAHYLRRRGQSLREFRKIYARKKFLSFSGRTTEKYSVQRLH